MPSNCGVRVPWTASGSNQSVLKEINPEYSLKGVMLKLKLQIFGHLMQRADSLKRPWCWERVKAEGEGDDRMRGLDGVPGSMDMSLSKLREMVKDREPDMLQSMGSSRVGRDWTRVGDCTQSPGPLPSLEVRAGIECSNPHGWLYWGPAPISRWESERCLISVTKVTCISFITGNSKGFRSSC